ATGSRDSKSTSAARWASTRTSAASSAATRSPRRSSRTTWRASSASTRSSAPTANSSATGWRARRRRTCSEHRTQPGHRGPQRPPQPQPRRRHALRLLRRRGPVARRRNRLRVAVPRMLPRLHRQAPRARRQGGHRMSTRTHADAREDVLARDGVAKRLLNLALDHGPALEKYTAGEVLEWATEHLRTPVAVTLSMQDTVLAELAERHAPGADLIFLDTGYHFDE